TASAAAGSDAPDMMAPISTTLAGSAQTRPVMNTACGRVMPASRARPAKPTNALMRIRPGIDTADATPRKNQRVRVESLSGEAEAAGFINRQIAWRGGTCDTSTLVPDL